MSNLLNKKLEYEVLKYLQSEGTLSYLDLISDAQREQYIYEVSKTFGFLRYQLAKSFKQLSDELQKEVAPIMKLFGKRVK